MKRDSTYLLLLTLLSLLLSCSKATFERGVVATQTSLPSITTSIPVISTSSGQPISVFPYQRIGNGDLEQVKWTRDGKNIILGTTTGIFVYDAEKFELINEFETGHPVYYLAIHPSGKIISVGADEENDENITLWNIQTGKPVITLHGDCGCVFTNVAFSPDGSLLAAGNNKGQIWIWEWTSESVFRILEFQNTLENPFVKYVQFSPDGFSLVAGDERGRVELFDLQAGEIIKDFNTKFLFLYALEFNPDGKKLAIAGNLISEVGVVDQYQVNIFDTASDTLLYTIDLGSKDVDFVRFNPDNTSLITGSCQSYGSHSEVCLNAQVKQWNTFKGTFEREIREYASSLVGGDYSPDGKRFSILTWDTTPVFETWDFETDQIIESMQWYVGPSSSIVFSSDSKTVLWGENNGSIRNFDVKTKKIVSTWEGSDGSIVNLAMSTNGSMLASSSRYGDITVWDFHKGSVLQKIHARKGFEIYSIKFSHDDRFLTWTEEDIYRDNQDQIQIYNLEQKKTQLSIFGTSFYTAISPDASTIAIADANSNSIRLFEMTTGNLLKTFSAPDSISQIEFNEAGTMLVSSCFNTNIIFWEIVSGGLLNNFDAFPQSDTGSVSFALFPGGKYLVFGASRVMKVLNMTNYHLVFEITHYIGGTENFTVSPNGYILATSRPGEVAWLWEVDGIH